MDDASRREIFDKLLKDCEYPWQKEAVRKASEKGSRWTEAYLEVAGMDMLSDMRRIADTMIECVGDPDPGLQTCLPGLGHRLGYALIALADDGFREDPDLRPLGDMSIEYARAGMADAVHDFWGWAFMTMCAACPAERLTASRAMYLASLVLMQGFRAGIAPSSILVMNAFRQNTIDEVNRMKGGRPFARYAGDVLFFEDLVIALTDTTRQEMEVMDDIYRAWVDAGSEHFYDELSEIRRLYIADTIDREEARARMTELVRELISEPPALCDTVCSVCRRRSPSVDPWTCPFCGSREPVSPEELVFEKVVDGLRRRDPDSISESIDSAGLSPDSPLLPALRCFSQVHGRTADMAFRRMADAMGELDEKQTAAYAECLVTLFGYISPSGLLSAAIVPLDRVTAMVPWSGDSRFEIACMDAVFGNMEEESEFTVPGLIGQLAACAVHNAESQDAALDAVLRAYDIAESIDPEFGGALVDCMDSLYTRISDMDGGSFLSSRGNFLDLRLGVKDWCASEYSRTRNGIFRYSGRMIDAYFGDTAMPVPVYKSPEIVTELDADECRRIEEMLGPDMDVDDIEEVEVWTRDAMKDHPGDWRGWHLEALSVLRYYGDVERAMKAWESAAVLIPEDKLEWLADLAVTESVAAMYRPEYPDSVGDYTMDSDLSTISCFEAALLSRDGGMMQPGTLVSRIFEGLVGRFTEEGPKKDHSALLLGFHLVKACMEAHPDPRKHIDCCRKFVELFEDVAEQESWLDKHITFAEAYSGALAEAGGADDVVAEHVIGLWVNDIRYLRFIDCLDRASEIAYEFWSLDDEDPWNDGLTDAAVEVAAMLMGGPERRRCAAGERYHVGRDRIEPQRRESRI